MTFQDGEALNFQSHFKSVRSKIEAVQGCRNLILYRDLRNPNRFFTYSHWESEADLENYRSSKLFLDIWATTKKMFEDKAQAWSVTEVKSEPTS